MVWAVIGSQRTWWQPVGLLQLERGGRRGLETSVPYYQSMASNSSEERGSQDQGFSQIIWFRIAGSSQESKQEFPE
jgi:hypothetical protein